MKVFVATQAGKFLGAYRVRERAIKSVLVDMFTHNVDETSIQSAKSSFCNHGNNSYDIWKIIPIEVE